MPELSRFFGITIRIHFDDHQPPHFHALYGEFEVEVAIRRIEVLKGQLPSRALGLTIEWAALHQEELMDAWKRASRHEPLRRIEPLR